MDPGSCPGARPGEEARPGLDLVRVTGNGMNDRDKTTGGGRNGAEQDGAERRIGLRPRDGRWGARSRDGRDGRQGWRREDGRHVGEAQVRLAFHGSRGAPFGFLCMDPDTLRDHARSAGPALERVLPISDGAFLAGLAPTDGGAAATGDRKHAERETG